MAITVRDKKITAQTAATVALAHLALADTTAATQWFDKCLAIASDNYPYIEARALIGLTATQLATADPASASHTAEQATKIAAAHGFRLLEEQALSMRHDFAHKQNLSAGHGTSRIPTA